MSDAYIDDAQANNLIGEIGAELFAQVVSMFASEVKQRIPEILAAYASEDYEALANYAHSIRASAASVGCLKLATSLKLVELAAREGTLRDIEPLVAELPDLMQMSLAALSGFIAK